MDYKHKNRKLSSVVIFFTDFFQHPVSSITQSHNVVNSFFKMSFHAAEAAWKRYDDYLDLLMTGFLSWGPSTGCLEPTTVVTLKNL